MILMCTSTRCPVSQNIKMHGVCPFENCKEFKRGTCVSCKYYARHESVCCNADSKWYGKEMEHTSGCRGWAPKGFVEVSK